MKPTSRASRITLELHQYGVSVIEDHPSSSRKAFQMPKKEWKTIQGIFKEIGLTEDLNKRALTPHEIDATTAALMRYLHLKRKTQLIGDPKEGIIVLPEPRDWRTLEP